MADNTLEAILTRIKREFRQEIIDTINTKISIDLLNYYNKTETYTKLEVNNLISNINTLKMEIVSELPTESIDTNTIYLLPQGVPSENNIYDEYIYINQWELIGSTGIDLTSLVTNQEFQEATDGIWEQVNTNTENISSNTAKIGTNTAKIGTNTTDISSLKTRMNTAENNISTNTGNISTNTADISNLKSKTNTLDTSKVNRAGDTMTGNLYVSKSSEPLIGVTNGTRKIVLMIGSGGVNRGIHDSIDNAWIVYKDESNLNTPLPFKTEAGEVKYTDKSSIKYNSTDECIEFIFN